MKRYFNLCVIGVNIITPNENCLISQYAMIFVFISRLNAYVGNRQRKREMNGSRGDSGSLVNVCRSLHSTSDFSSEIYLKPLCDTYLKCHYPHLQGWLPQCKCCLPDRTYSNHKRRFKAIQRSRICPCYKTLNHHFRRPDKLYKGKRIDCTVVK